ncbi:prolyl oligopeptidase family serine peptidase [bacterium]|nr:prolyl oligopeptidase family serine peptidase [bacterium]
MRTTAYLFLAVLLIGSSVYGAPVDLDDWLVAGPAEAPYGQLDELDDYNAVSDLFEADPFHARELWASNGMELRLAPFETSSFRAEELSLDAPEVGSRTLKYAAAASYLKVPAWQKGSLVVRGAAPFRLYLDGEKLMERTSAADSDTTEMSESATIDQGTRRLLLVTALTGSDSLATWSFEVRYEADEDTPEEWMPNGSTDPMHGFELPDYPMMESVGDLSMSPDGKYLAVRVGWREGPELKAKSELRVLDMKRREVVWSYGESVRPSPLLWAPDSRSLLLGLSGDKGKDLFLLTTNDWLLQRVARGLEDAGSFEYAPDGRGLYYTRNIEAAESDREYKVMWGLEDRWGGWRDLTEFRYYAFEGGVSIPVAKGKYGPDSFVIAPDGSAIYAYRSVPEVERPFGKIEFWKIPTNGGEAEKFGGMRVTRSGALTISPDGKTLAYVGPPAEVMGNDDPLENAHNTNNSDLWLIDIATGEARNMTRDFDPDVDGSSYGTGGSSDVVWGEDGKIHFSAFYDKSMYYCTMDPKSGEIEQQKLASSGFANLAIPKAKGATVVAYRADNLAQYSDIRWYDVKRKRGGDLLPLNEALASIAAPAVRVEDYDFVNSEGITVPGYLYYPAGYDPDGSYPMIVDTYGGVIGFGDGFMWGSNQWANRGYFVYVPIPRGANGYGEEFADAHLHEWGVTTSADMNQGVKHIVENVQGVDGSRVGFDSGSYGGFLAMYLLSMDKDDPNYYPYKTAVGGYGISNLASYWGVGNWGYWYMEVSAPGYFPWNQPQWFIEHSPLYQADKIDVPLLLVHGDADNNVPPMESDQMYTALKQLGKEVVFVRFPGEGHGTANDRRHYMERKRIETEWFDKYLKDQPGAFDERMKEEFKK